MMYYDYYYFPKNTRIYNFFVKKGVFRVDTRWSLFHYCLGEWKLYYGYIPYKCRSQFKSFEIDEDEVKTKAMLLELEK